jgi:hypothetical protein
MTEEILRDPCLVEKIVDEVHKEFYGEEDSIMALIVSINTRLVKGCKPESRNIVVSEMSGAGKDRLIKTLCSILLEPEKTYFHRSKLTPEVFTYWHTNNKKWSWDGKVIHIEDPDVDLINCQGFKTMASGEKQATVVDKQKAKDLLVQGKPNLIITTFEGCADIEGIRRYPFIHLDTSDELTRQVKMGISKQYSKEYTAKQDKELRRKLRNLKSFHVTIPYASELIDYFPDNLIARTYYSRFLDYIASSCVLHQFQREMDKDGWLIATREDYELGRITFLKTVSNIAMIPLSRDQQTLLEVLTKHSKPMFVADIHKEIPKERDWIYRNCEVLKRHGLIRQDTMFKEDANKHVITYEVVGGFYDGHLLPSTERLYGCSGFLRNLRNVDAERKKKGLEPIYERYYRYISTTTNTTNTTYREEQSDDHNTTILQPDLDKMLKQFGGRREDSMDDDIYTPEQRYVGKMLKKISSGTISDDEREKFQQFVKEVLKRKE